MVSNKLRVALIGCGRMGLHHVKAIEIQDAAEVVAVADPVIDTEQLERVAGRKIDVFSDAGEMLKKVKPDVVHIVTPPDSHARLARLALENGAHIYVEKPFSLHASEAEDILALAHEKGLKACAAHQVLYQYSGVKYREYLPLIGRVKHVESYFSFKTVRRSGSSLMSSVEQLEDILPHPVYLLLGALEEEADNQEIELHSLAVDSEGEVRAIVRQGDALAVLIVSLQARPIESYLRICGTNGSINADFVLKGVVKLPGPGASAIAAVLQPFSEARQMVFGTFASIFRMVFKKQKSYAGLAELLQLFYSSLLKDASLPMSYESIIRTVDLCEQIGVKLRESEAAAEQKATQALVKAEAELDPVDSSHGTILVTGGTGFLGKELVRELRGLGWPVRVVARKIPSPANKVPGVEYVPGDIGEQIQDEHFNGVSIVAHLAAETVGGKEEHERNTIGATRNIVEASIKNGIRRFINISSIAILKPSTAFGEPLREDSPIDAGNIGRGPYVWAKAGAEGIVAELCKSNNVEYKTIRLGPLVDFRKFTPPGRLGREVGTLYVAMGSSRSELSVCDVTTASNVIRYYVDNFESVPQVLNLVESPPPKRKELVARLRKTRPELKVMWMPSPVLKFLSLLLKGILKLLKPGKKPLDLYAAFASEKYDSSLAGSIINEAGKA